MSEDIAAGPIRRGRGKTPRKPGALALSRAKTEALAEKTQSPAQGVSVQSGRGQRAGSLDSIVAGQQRAARDEPEHNPEELHHTEKVRGHCSMSSIEIVCEGCGSEAMYDDLGHSLD